MRIGLDLTHAYQRSGGIQRYAIELVRALLTLDTANDYVLFFRGEVRPELANLRAKVLVSPIKHQVLCEQTWLWWAAQQAKLDVFHLTGFAGPLGYGRPSVSTVCDVNQFLYPETLKLSQRLYWRWFLPLALKRRRAVIAISENSQRDISRLLHVQKEKITAIPLAVSTEFLEPRSPAQLDIVRGKYCLPNNFFLAVGTVEPRKNHLRILEAYAQLNRKIDSLPDLVIVGRRGWLYQPILRHIDQLGLSERVHFTGPVPDADLASIYRLADALLYPSLYEGFGLPILEAMASNCAVITSNTSSMPEVAGDAAEYVDPLNVQSIAEGMRAILNLENRAELIERGLERAKCFSWTRTAQETLAVYLAT